MELTDDLKTGISLVDEQHAKFLAALGKLQQGFKDELPTDEIHAYVNFLEVYAELHFAAEEHYIALYDYPDSAPHREDHARFKTDMEKLKSGVLQAEQNIQKLAQLAGFMLRWVTKHIKEHDKKFTEFLQQNGYEFKEDVPARPA